MTKRINSPDTDADIRLRDCLDKLPRVSFNMIAGAGSGKTTSLVKALSHAIKTNGNVLKMRGQQIACITYTEIAAKEIWDDVGNTPLIFVSTIHSFLWTVIRPFQRDIKKWVINRVSEKCKALEEKLANPRIRTRVKTEKELAKLRIQAEEVEKITYFNYGTGSNYSKGILGHDDLIKLVTSCIMENETLRKIISQKYPYIFVDESQDTFPNIVEALKQVDQSNSEKFCLGFFGDPMQKIYVTGIGEVHSEQNWEIITKPENFRCSQEVLKVINNIRKPADGLEQTGGRIETIDGKSSYVKGSAQIFVLPLQEEQQRTANLKKVQLVCAKMLSDDQWLIESKIKIFVIVHRMAAKRLGFPNLYSAMNDDSPTSFKEGFMEGSIWPIKPFLNFVLPIVFARGAKENSTIISILRSQSPKLSSPDMKGSEVRKSLDFLKAGLDELMLLMEENSTGTVLDVLNVLNKFQLTSIDERIFAHMNDSFAPMEDADEDTVANEISAMKRYFVCPAREFWSYKKYFEQQSPFATQQGVKGAEFDRVITVLDDDEGTHIQFSYDKYFGVTELSDNDNKNIEEGKDYVIPRTRRLFYVSCSRARKDLVVVYFTSNVDKAVEKLRELNIFGKDKIFTMENL
ncbi:ATP-dependent helicase [Niastella caeni]|uniref:ATP-dependent helicase n=1 Tax=Niastella caeni TaxID=2569763 RepID=A0A4S8I1L1_9BACT|nr:UvrD-helicase domain-containing protein [Niastella caeni]THU40384.1 ATP-dependent helicase [Niastella caeni]